LYVLVILAGLTAACSSVRSSAQDIQGVRDEPVTFRTAGATLSGTLFLPAGGDRHPAVVLFHGSGPQPRNSFMAHWFAEHGVAALTYDKRGVNASTGDFRTVAFTDLATDGLAAVALLKARHDIDARKIGVWGLSQGGWLGPLAASQSKDVAFVIAVSGPGVSPGEQMIFYYGSQLRERGFSDGEVNEAGEMRRQLWHLLSTGDGYGAAGRAVDHARSRPWFAAVNEQSDGLLSRPTKALLDDPALRGRLWYRSEVNYDPRIALRALSVPALFIFGDKDVVVPVEPSVAIIRQTLTDAGHRSFSIVVFPGADHGMFVTAAEGGRTLVPGYLDAIENWLQKTLRY
jgi:dipeptidyl aminopeptidase/acylaminoacyl peptidase